AFPRTSLCVHQHAVGGQRVALPFVPKPGAASRDIKRITPLQHDALDRRVAGRGAHFLQRLEIRRFNQRRQIEEAGVELADEALEPTASLSPGQRPQVLRSIEEDVVEAHERRKFSAYFRRYRLPAEPLLERVEACRRAAMLLGTLAGAAHQQLAVDHAADHEGFGNLWKAKRNIVAGS